MCVFFFVLLSATVVVFGVCACVCVYVFVLVIALRVCFVADFVCGGEIR